MAQVDFFLKLDGIKGESKDAKHKDEIELVSFSWGVSNEGPVHAGGGGGAGKARFNDFQVSMSTSKAMPELFLACASGQHIKEATLTVRKAGGTQLEYLKFKLSQVFVTSLQEAGSSGEPLPHDVVSFDFAKLQVTYQLQDPTGKPSGGPIVRGWDLTKNKKL